MEPNRNALLAELFGTEDVPEILSGRLLRTREVAKLFQVSERTVAEWARRGRIPSVRTPGGHRLYPADRVRDLLIASETAGDEPGTEPQPAGEPTDEAGGAES